MDVGTATLYCVSASGGIVAEKQVTVYPDKDYLKQVINICEDTVIERTNENKTLYRDFSRKLDYAYYVYYDEPMAARTAVILTPVNCCTLSTSWAATSA